MRHCKPCLCLDLGQGVVAAGDAVTDHHFCHGGDCCQCRLKVQRVAWLVFWVQGWEQEALTHW